MSSLHAKGLFYGLVYVHVYIHACWLKIRLEIYIPRTWKSKLKKKIDVEKWKNWMVLDYYELTSFSYSPLFLSVFVWVYFSLCEFLSLIPSLWLQPHFCQSLYSLFPCCIFLFLLSPAPSSVPLSSSSLPKAVPQIIHHIILSTLPCSIRKMRKHIWLHSDLKLGFGATNKQNTLRFCFICNSKVWTCQKHWYSFVVGNNNSHIIFQESPYH